MSVPHPAVTSALMCALATISACASHQAHVIGGSDLAPGDAAQLEFAAGMVLDAVDGDTEVHGASTETRPLVVHLEPGRHTLTIRYESQTGVDQKIMQTITTTHSDPLDFEVSIERGKVYTVNRTVSGDIWRPLFREKTPTDK